MREAPSFADRQKAKAVYDYMLTQPTDTVIPVVHVAHATGLSYQEAITGFHWAQRVYGRKDGVYLGSQKGPYGGYFRTDDRDVARDDQGRWLGEARTYLLRVQAKNDARRKAGLGNRTTLREINDGLISLINTVENALEKHNVIVGHVAADRAATPTTN